MAIKDYYKTLSPSEKTDFAYAVCKLCGFGFTAFIKKISTRGFKQAEEILIQEKIINKQV
ncbi:MAG: hypothetical protein IKL56_02555 [Bacteroidaceae bacterium]|nr:hypothetical protein [Bacteroidaceae bacterium]